jgi:hypothetical protein
LHTNQKEKKKSTTEQKGVQKFDKTGDDQRKEAPMSAATRATKPVAMTGLPAPFADPVAVEVDVGAVDAALDVDEPTAVDAPVLPAVFEAALALDVPPMGAVDWPSISACSEELNVPVIPAKLIEKTTSARIDTKEGLLRT